MQVKVDDDDDDAFTHPLDRGQPETWQFSDINERGFNQMCILWLMRPSLFEPCATQDLGLFRPPPPCLLGADAFTHRAGDRTLGLFPPPCLLGPDAFTRRARDRTETWQRNENVFTRYAIIFVTIWPFLNPVQLRNSVELDIFCMTHQKKRRLFSISCQIYVVSVVNFAKLFISMSCNAKGFHGYTAKAIAAHCK